MRKLSRSFVATVCVFAIVAAAPFANGQLPVIELSALSRSGGQTSSEFELRIAAGKHLDDANELKFSHPGIRVESRSDQTFRISIASDVDPGRYEVRALGRYGLSNPRLFLVTTLPNVVLDTVSHDASNPTPIALNTIYHARAASEQINYYSMHLEAGDSIQIDLLSQSIDSRMIGKVMLRDAGDSSSRSARGSDNVDPRLTFIAPQSRDYVVAVNDFLLGGGDEYPYQLCVQTKASAIDLLGSDDAAVKVPRHALPEAFTLLNQSVSNLAQVEESSNSHVLTPPSMLAAIFDGSEDQDVYQIDAQAGETFAVELQSQRLGQPTDGRIEVERSEPEPTGEPKWQPMISHDDSQEISDVAVSVFTRDPAFTFQATTAGIYRLLVRDLDNGSSLGQSQEYRLSVRHPNPDFALLAYTPASINDLTKSKPTGTCLLRGGTQSIKVLLVRRDGWSGAVTVRAEGLPEHVTCNEVTIAPTQNQVHLTLVGGDLANDWTGAIRILGTASIDAAGGNVERPAIPATITWGADTVHKFVRARLCTELLLGVRTRDTMPLSIGFGSSELIKLKAGETTALPIKLTRRDGGKQACTLRPRDLPPGVTVAETSIPTDKQDGQVELKVSPDAVAGIYSIWLQAETKIKLASQANELSVFVASPTVTIEIAKP